MGVLHLFRGPADLASGTARRCRSIGPVWDGNEVWLLAGGGTLYFGRHSRRCTRQRFSGFYLPLMIVLWLLILRGISLELRNAP